MVFLAGERLAYNEMVLKTTYKTHLYFEASRGSNVGSFIVFSPLSYDTLSKGKERQ